MTEKIKTIAVVGLGYVGLPLALLAEKKGYTVIGVIRDQKKAERINEKIPPFKDELVEKYLPHSSLYATTDFSYVKKASIIIICVPTPVKENYIPDLGPVLSASENIGKYLQKGQLVILESTVNPGVSEDVVIPAIEKVSGMKVKKDFHFAHCPERINPGDPKWNVENINRVIGASDETALDLGEHFYQSILTGNIRRMESLKEAEAVKVVENSFRDINIAFVNELALSFSKLGIDVVNVIDGAATKPFAFLPHYPGCGVGGHCIPVDPYYLIEYAKSKGFNHDFLSLARRINNAMPEFTVSRLLFALNEKGLSVKGKKIAVLGISYKADIDDDRESPSYEIIESLKELGARVETYDPYILEKSTAQSLDEALTDATAIVITTPHTEFKKLQLSDLEKKGIAVIVDGRNSLDKKAFEQSSILYRGIGR